MLPEATMHERGDGSGADARRPITGVERLRERRGKERVTFADVADHLQDFAVANPNDRGLIDRLGTFLAEAEAKPHGHDGPTPGSDVVADNPRLVEGRSPSA
jgi:uncharacterized protein DUF6104